ncbi:GNAT family N-acetyltransferase [Jeotgalibacillus aurantiacus]|uniref:GNAT family N-acetyltransferase n=1 Tax=Jeotgalibacillus aurantiacus TaxID=2763266 RepID=UPI001D0AECAE|nr:GNAT family N-acetyltransferase [Jeotgalibacillus aurantiacus]
MIRISECPDKFNGQHAIQLIEAENHHDPFLYALFASTRMGEVSSWQWSDEMASHFLKMQWQAQKLSYQHQFSRAKNFIVQMNTDQIGRLMVNEDDSSIQLIDIAIMPDYQNKKLGSFMIELVQMEAQSKGKDVRLMVKRNNPALKLYKRLDFFVIEENSLDLKMVWRSSENR